MGQYELQGTHLTLKFNGKKSEYFGTEYLMGNNEIKCLDCENETSLKIKD